jgi:hypothetical protein
VVIKFVLFENKQSSQIGILEELAISLVTFLIPASYLTGLITLMLASKSTLYREISIEGLTLSQYQKDEHLLHRCRETAFLPHLWHILIPSSSVENCWTWSFNTSNLCSDIGKICVTFAFS